MRLLTTPQAAGYTQNPISVYYCYDRGGGGDGDGGAGDVEGALVAAIAEVCVCVLGAVQCSCACVCRAPSKKSNHPKQKKVTNTPWGERVAFKFDPAGDATPKALHVSPFMDMQNEWWVFFCCCCVCRDSALTHAHCHTHKKQNKKAPQGERAGRAPRAQRARHAPDARRLL